MLLQIILCDKPTGDFLRMRTLFQRTSAKATCSKKFDAREIHPGCSRNSIVAMRTYTHETYAGWWFQIFFIFTPL